MLFVCDNNRLLRAAAIMSVPEDKVACLVTGPQHAALWVGSAVTLGCQARQHASSPWRLMPRVCRQGPSTNLGLKLKVHCNCQSLLARTTL